MDNTTLAIGEITTQYGGITKPTVSSVILFFIIFIINILFTLLLFKLTDKVLAKNIKFNDQRIYTFDILFISLSIILLFSNFITGFIFLRELVWVFL